MLSSGNERWDQDERYSVNVVAKSGDSSPFVFELMEPNGEHRLTKFEICLKYHQP